VLVFVRLGNKLIQHALNIACHRRIVGFVNEYARGFMWHIQLKHPAFAAGILHRFFHNAGNFKLSRAPLRLDY
jgi:hypothetical protein